MTRVNYNNKRFRPLSNTDNGEVDDEVIFHYYQKGNILTSSYSGGRIVQGHLIGIVDENGCISMSYHQVNTGGHIMTGLCNSRPEIMSNGKIRLHEEWRWTSGDGSSGESVIEEI